MDYKLESLCPLPRGTTAALECLAKSKRIVVGSGYKSLAKHLTQFQSLGYMPMVTDVRRTDYGDGFEVTMMRHQASWHKLCHLKFNQINLTDYVRKCNLSSSDHAIDLI